ncbi:methylase involved in ubiquinone/menaquinone biosynthesis [Clostridium aceticum]|uniref:Methylase involved in ubiquinone/menaquinone biosynthesis n=1 Tax=Clostridium aceticum TaxID=84022 RepID=A0A0D8I5N6_9CLOT|nr:class I SAM-dependent methyltransferase [Clostridium aceticum]AKL94711.1 methylase involved in ubiquinone/menaquinone biosynthesis [Clostridium aceticum]KJF25563.1 hypothetical protein TZ02_18025 [Clostridium aceticum]
MTIISDSDATLELQRILPQHQSAITLLNTTLQNPQVRQITWLDLACGKGQIISQLKENLSDENRKKIVYDGYDINVGFTKVASRIAGNLDFKDYNFNHGDLSKFTNILEPSQKFDFITCTNVAHELHPNCFVTLVIESLKRLSDIGQLFIYDMESLINPELGALPLKGNEIKDLLNIIFECVGSQYKVHPSVWIHKTCRGWSVVINRPHLNVCNGVFDDKKEEITNRVKDKISNILEIRFNECCELLNTFTIYGADTAEDEQLKLAALYEFWAISNAKEEIK